MKTHPLRIDLHDEIHTRPRPPVRAPHSVSHISLLQTQRLPRPLPPALIDWCVRHAVDPPAPGRNHFEADLGPLRLKWERHGEFDDYTVYGAGCDIERPFARAASDTLLDTLLSTDGAEVIAALRVAVVHADRARIDERSVGAMLEAPSFVGAKISDGQASLFSSFRLDDRGFGRFQQLSTAGAYRTLVRTRGQELRETRLQGLQTPTGFLERRFQPAMAYCDAVSERLASVSERIARASGLLRTRVEIERERQNQALLAAMNRRAKLQLHLQQTVEGLSVAAITYYATGLAGYVFKGAAVAGAPIHPELATGIAVVPILLGVAWGMRSIRRKVTGAMDAD